MFGTVVPKTAQVLMSTVYRFSETYYGKLVYFSSTPNLLLQYIIDMSINERPYYRHAIIASVLGR